MPRKVRELIADLEAAGFVDRGGKGSHRNYVNRAPPATSTLRHASSPSGRNVPLKRNRSHRTLYPTSHLFHRASDAELVW